MKPYKLAQGFTIVELLVVVVLIAILAAITVAAYNGLQNRANNTAVQSDLNSLAKTVGLQNAEFGTYPTAVQFQALQGLRVAKGSYFNTAALLYCGKTDGSAFAIVGRSRSGDTFYISSNTGAAKTHPGIGATAVATCADAGITSDSSVWLHNPGFYGTANGGWVAWVQS